jgi:eukaryotic-like serine/threonine-protein kinase
VQKRQPIALVKTLKQSIGHWYLRAQRRFNSQNCRKIKKISSLPKRSAFTVQYNELFDFRIRQIFAAKSVMSDEKKVGEITVLVDRYLDLQSRGESVSVDQLCEDVPHLVEPVKCELLALERMDRLLQSHQSHVPHSCLPKSEVSHPSPVTGDINKRPVSQLGKRTGTRHATAEFSLDQLHGHGGCSEVYVAHDKVLQRTIALKFLRPENSDNELLRQRLKREAAITSKLDHPGVVSIYWLGSENDGAPFYSMQFVAGKTLGEAIDELHAKKSTLRSRAEFVQHARKLLIHFVDVCQTIAYAHSQRVVHRDIKPSNIVIGQFGETYVVDWGLAKDIGEEVSASTKDSARQNDHDFELTRNGTSIGTPAFMSPEQASGNCQTGTPTDIFSLGATLYAILTGKPPYTGDSLVDIVSAAENARYTPANIINRNLPAALAAICHKAMARQVNDRYENSLQLAEDIEAFLADQPVLAYREPWFDRARRWISKRRTFVFTAASTIVVALVLLIIGNALLINFNRQLSKRESEALQYQAQTQTALDQATVAIYNQLIALAQSELNNNNFKRAQEILNRCPQHQRQWEWRLLMWMIDRHEPIATLNTDGPQTLCLEFSRDGTRVAAASTNGAIRIWQVGTWNQLQLIPDNIRIKSLAWSPDNQSIIVCGTQRNRAIVRRWNLLTQLVESERTSGSDSINDVAYSPDGKFAVTVESDGYIKIRDAETLVPKIRVRPEEHSDQVNAVSFDHSTGEFYTCGSDGYVFGWNIQGQPIADLPRQPTPLNDVCVCGNNLITVGSDGHVGLWQLNESSDDKKQWVLARSVAAHSDHVLSAEIAPQEAFAVTGGLDRNIRVIHLETGDILTTIQRHSSHVQQIRVDPTGQYLVSTGDDNVVQIWDFKRLTANVPRGRFVAYCGDGDQELTLIADDQMVYVWDHVDRRLQLRITDHPAGIMGLVGSDNGCFATLYRDGTVRIWNPNSGKMLYEFGDQSYRVANSALFLSDQSQLVVGYHNGVAECYDLDDGHVRWQIKTDAIAYRIAADRSGKTLFVGTPDGFIESWDIESKSLNKKIKAHQRAVLRLHFHPTLNRVASASNDGQIKIWDTDLSAPILTMRSGASWLNCISFTPDGQRLVSGNEHTLTCWDSSTGKEVLSMPLERCVHEISFNGDGTEFAIASDRRGSDPRNVPLPVIRIYRAPFQE